MLQNHEKGNVLLYVLIGIVLVGLLTVALRSSGGYKEDIDTESLVIKAGEVQRYGAELARAVNILLEKKVSEADIRFAHPDAGVEYGNITTDPENQIFSSDGGRAPYRAAPTGVNDGSAWEFFATSQIPQVGSDKAELIAVLPNVTAGFCAAMNGQLGFDPSTQPTDGPAGAPPCVSGAAIDRFAGTYDDAAPNSLTDATFSKLPAYQACVLCESDSNYHYFYVLMAR